jgi:5'-3' exonuclease
MSKHLILVDASGFAHRAFFANPAYYREDGFPIWAVLGFMGMTWSLLKRAKIDPPTHGAAVFDAPGRTFRHDLFPEYKANRPAARRKELVPQLPLMRHAAKAMGLEAVEATGFEADDVIATLATKAANQGIRTTIISSDKDFCQLVRDGVIEVIDTMARDKKQPDGTVEFVRQRFRAADVKAKFGVPPDLVADVQALWGDDVDNIPGIDGVGGKTAGQLIAQFKGLEPLLAAARRSGTAFATAAIRKRLREQADQARLYKRLATLDTGVKGLPDLESLALHPADRDHLKEMLRVLGEQRRFEIMFGGNPETTLRLPHVDAPLRWWHAIPKNQANALTTIPRDPQDGFFKTKVVRGGPWVPARVWRDEEVDFVTGAKTGFDIVKCEVDGKPRNPLSAWIAIAKMPISATDFDHMVALASWSKKYAPTSAEANTGIPIDWNKEPL